MRFIILLIAICSLIGTTVAQAEIRLKPDAPPFAHAIFEDLCNRRDVEIINTKKAIASESELLEGYKSAVIAPTLRRNESPRKTPKGIWAFKTKAEKEAAIAEQQAKIDSLNDLEKALSDDNYLPRFNPKERRLRGSVGHEDAINYSAKELEEVIFYGDINTDLGDGWFGTVPECEIVAVGNSTAAVMLLSDVEVYFEREDGSRLAGANAPPPKIVRMKVRKAYIERSLVGNAARGEIVDLADQLFTCEVRNGELYLTKQQFEPWIELVASTQPTK